MPRTRRKFTPEFKANVVHRLIGGEKVSAVAKELQIADSVLRQWVKASRSATEIGRLSPFGPAERAELFQLRQEVGRLTVERDTYRKALGLLAGL